MRATGTVLAGILFIFGVSMAGATSIKYARGPAEMPPAGFTGKQFVDSKGCVYIKAGYSGKITWVPRSQRNRQVICGKAPTFARSGAGRKTTRPVPIKVHAPQSVANSSRPTVIAISTSRPTVIAISTGTANVRTRVARPAAQMARPTVSGKPAPTIFKAYKRTARAAPVKPLFPVRRPFATAQTPRRAAPAVTVFTVQTITTQKPTRVVRKTPRRHRGIYAIRTGPQKVHPADAVKRYRREHGIQVASAPYAVPKGYVSLLNDRSGRGVGTPQGRAAMDLLWTQTMPRRLIDVTTGTDMTASLPQIRYPYTTPQTTRRAVRVASTTAATSPRLTKPKSKLKRIKKPVSDAASPLNMSALKHITSIEDVSAVSNRPTLHAGVQPVASHRFVQVATFGVPANARRTLAGFSDKGLPVNKRPTRYKGKNMDIVLLGPFRDQRMLNEALTQARAAGFSDAFFVN